MSTKTKSDGPNTGDVIKSLESKIEESMKAFHERLGATKLTSLQQLANEFMEFRDSVRSVLEALKAQIGVLSNAYDELDTRSRRKLFRGVSETKEESPTAAICKIMSINLQLPNIKEDAIKSYYRLGSAEKGNGPILIKFHSMTDCNSVWRAKNKLKGTGISVTEFLTPNRRELFKKARRLFGMQRSWTQDGNIIVKLEDGTKVRVNTLQQLQILPLPIAPTPDEVPKKRREKKPIK